MSIATAPLAPLAQVVPKFEQGSSCVRENKGFCWDWFTQNFDRVFAHRIVQHIDASDPTSGRAQGFRLEQPFDLILLLRGELTAFPREELDAVIGVRIVRGAYYGSSRSSEARREGRDAGRWQNAEIDDIGAPARDAGGEGA